MRDILRSFVIFFGLICLWQGFVVLTKLPSYFLPSPWVVGNTFIQQFPLLLSQAIPTLIETVLGLLGAMIFGCLTAIGMAYLQTLRIWLKPVLLISQALPTFAVAPLFVIWLGYGMSAKILTTVLMLFFPITSAFFDGLQRTPRGWLDLAKMSQASTWQIMRHIRIPAALPALVSGLRVATAAAPMGAVIGEWVGASNGLGFLIMNANARMQIDMMFAALCMLILWNLLFYFSVDYFLRRAVNWQ